MKRILAFIVILFSVAVLSIPAPSQVISVLGYGKGTYSFGTKVGLRKANGRFTSYVTHADSGSGMGSNSSYEIFSRCHTIRLRQNGPVYKVEFPFGNKNVATMTAIYIRWWRWDGSAWDRVAQSENLLSAVTSNQLNSITLATPVTGPLEGDWPSMRIEGTGTSPTLNQFIYRSNGGSEVRAIINSNPDQNFNWAAQTLLIDNRQHQIVCYTSAPSVVGIGYSHIEGQTDHRSFAFDVQPTLDVSTTAIDSTIWKQLATLTGASYQNMGRGGETSSSIRARITTDATAQFPSVLVIQMGGNDTARPTSIVYNDMVAVLDTCGARSIKPVVLCVGPATSFTDAQHAHVDSLNAILENLCRTHSSGAVWVDYTARVGAVDGTGYTGNLWSIKTGYAEGDNLHYTSRANFWIAKRIIQELNRSTILN